MRRPGYQLTCRAPATDNRCRLAADGTADYAPLSPRRGTQVWEHAADRSPALTAPRIVSGPTLLTGICFCAACGGAMTLEPEKIVSRHATA